MIISFINYVYFNDDKIINIYLYDYLIINDYDGYGIMIEIIYV
jgi:hypothetical protein